MPRTSQRLIGPALARKAPERSGVPFLVTTCRRARRASVPHRIKFMEPLPASLGGLRSLRNRPAGSPLAPRVRAHLFDLSCRRCPLAVNWMHDSRRGSCGLSGATGRAAPRLLGRDQTELREVRLLTGASPRGFVIRAGRQPVDTAWAPAAAKSVPRLLSSAAFVCRIARVAATPR